ncbi:MAG: 30S ribosome-binding factor RbfA [Nannocystaceae bacterium]|nr:30S ribosome-binding factor RbfA [Myxococcales bacterium]
MNKRRERVEENLRRVIADVLLFGNLRDPRLSGETGVGVTAVRVTPDLSIARVYIDPVVADGRDPEALLAGLQAAAPSIRRELGRQLKMRRVPELRFMRDESIERGLAIERVLQELRDEDVVQESVPGDTSEDP